MLWIFQNVASHSKNFFRVWFQTKHQLGMGRWRCVFVIPHKELHFIWTYLFSASSKLGIVSEVLKNHHVIGIQTKSVVTFMEQILCDIDHGKIVLRTTCKQMNDLKSLSCFVHKVIFYNKIFFLLLEILAQLSRNTFDIFLPVGKLWVFFLIITL